MEAAQQKERKNAHPGQGFESEMVSFDGLYFMAPRIPAVAVHHECHMLRNGALPQRPDKRLSEPTESPFGGRRVHEPVPSAREIEVRHFERLIVEQRVGTRSATWNRLMCGVVCATVVPSFESGGRDLEDGSIERV